MSDAIPKPHIHNVIMNSAKTFTLHVMAYRQLTKNELKYCLAQYLQAKGLKQLPASGEDEVTSNIGFDGEQFRPFDQAGL
jgi:hypothetical protein